ncbi:MAG: hypothetical protein A3G80_04185 [Betaproteobacteria bacterium RIFCSPLOWO2_12_FULL_62_13b]|nr:MAG: hypothetical protein A3G80_04185 [Betaproteobacteria bacterium RIFCSPLOWO2_12_FULL_62_13b]
MWPFAGARATACRARLPPAPGRLSITIGWPSRGDSAWAITRARMSGEPPGGTKTTKVIGRDG